MSREIIGQPVLLANWLERPSPEEVLSSSGLEREYNCLCRGRVDHFRHAPSLLSHPSAPPPPLALPCQPLEGSSSFRLPPPFSPIPSPSQCPAIRAVGLGMSRGGEGEGGGGRMRACAPGKHNNSRPRRPRGQGAQRPGAEARVGLRRNNQYHITPRLLTDSPPPPSSNPTDFRPFVKTERISLSSVWKL